MQGRHASECGCGCGCGVTGCGKSPCYVAFLATSSIVDGVFEVLALGDVKTIVAAGNGDSPMASDLLAKMARIICMFDGFDVKSSCGRVCTGGLIMEISSFLAKRGAIRDILPILRFWEGSNRQDEPDNNSYNCGHQPRWCILLLVIQLLQLKLLFPC
jgi:hypothetical protein